MRAVEVPLRHLLHPLEQLALLQLVVRNKAPQQLLHATVRSRGHVCDDPPALLLRRVSVLVQLLEVLHRVLSGVERSVMTP